VNAAVEALERTLALELAPRRVNVVVPGIVDTGKRFADLPGPEREQKLGAIFGENLPVRRVGRPQDLAQAYIFAMQNPYLTGQSPSSLMAAQLSLEASAEQKITHEPSCLREKHCDGAEFHAPQHFSRSRSR
jgi:Enoyl-(Acyl carrier protein) reductase